MLLLTYVPNMIFLLVFWLVIRTIPKSPWKTESMSFRCLVQIFVMMYAVASVMNVIGAGISHVSPAGGTEQLDMIGKIVTSGLLTGVLMTVVLAPIVEELVFRKLMLDRIRNYGEKTAIVFSALCFGLFHGNLTQFLYAFAVGLFLGYVYCRTGKIHITMIMHALLNGLSSMLLLVAPLLQKGVGELAILLLVLAIVVMLIGGVVQLVRHLKSRDLHLDDSMEACLSRTQVLKTVYLNPCVLMFVLYCVVEITTDLLNIHVAVF